MDHCQPAQGSDSQRRQQCPPASEDGLGGQRVALCPLVVQGVLLLQVLQGKNCGQEFRVTCARRAYLRRK